MLKIVIRILVVVIILSGLGGTGYLLYVKKNLDAEIVFLNEELKSVKNRVRAAQKKYTQEKAKLGTCMRVKMAEENKTVQLKKELKKSVAEKMAVQDKLEGAEKEFQKKTAALNKKVERMKEIRAQIEESRQKIIDKYKISVQDGREKTAQIKNLEVEKKELEFEVRHLGKELDRNFKHNQRLSEIAEELAQKYREKAGKGAEPFTKLGMIEMEHLVQNYIKQIDKEKIIEQ